VAVAVAVAGKATLTEYDNIQPPRPCVDRTAQLENTTQEQNTTSLFLPVDSLAMAGLDIPISNDLRQLIFYFLDNNLLHNALFLATRLQAREASADATHILSLCYLRLNQLSAAAEHSESFAKTGQHLGCIYVFAQCCLGLGQFKNGIQALKQSKSLWRKNDNWGKYCQTIGLNSFGKS